MANRTAVSHVSLLRFNPVSALETGFLADTSEAKNPVSKAETG
jgi:hypothetical protein